MKWYQLFRDFFNAEFLFVLSSDFLSASVPREILHYRGSTSDICLLQRYHSTLSPAELLQFPECVSDISDSLFFNEMSLVMIVETCCVEQYAYACL
jgi:hypothetical protein